MIKTIAIRVDSSTLIGAGHLMRCLTLAEVLRAKGATISFIMRDLPGNGIDSVLKKGFAVHKLLYHKKEVELVESNIYKKWLEEDWQVDAMQVLQYCKLQKDLIDLLIVDHYALDKKWENLLRPAFKSILAIDDLANREHDCDILLDQNLYPNQGERYSKLLPSSCKTLYGPAYVLLRKEFHTYRNKLRPRENVNRVLIFLGGADADNVTETVIHASRNISCSDIRFDVVVGFANPHHEKIKKICANLPAFHYYYQVSNMAELMNAADLAIGAGGIATWERCSMGLPTIMMSIGEHEEAFARTFSDLGAMKYLGKATELSGESIAKELKELIFNHQARQSMGTIAFNLVDGLGSDRVVSYLYG